MNNCPLIRSEVMARVWQDAPDCKPYRTKFGVLAGCPDPGTSQGRLKIGYLIQLELLLTLLSAN